MGKFVVISSVSTTSFCCTQPKVGLYQQALAYPSLPSPGLVHQHSRPRPPQPHRSHRICKWYSNCAAEASTPMCGCVVGRSRAKIRTALQDLGCEAVDGRVLIGRRMVSSTAAHTHKPPTYDKRRCVSRFDGGMGGQHIAGNWKHNAPLRFKSRTFRN
ncbi:hypothetical protein M0657_011160 [Pyricularia oryzae]|nr:hypothetical protein M9X92_011322 [Pyricularia oryzae]KAI7910982.1 hypothetical protein M0657_011160 [Pyricularia oryzae]